MRKDGSTQRAASWEQAWSELRYQSARKPKLRSPALVVPPPIPSDAALQEAVVDYDPALDEGQPEEVGLRVLAALESLPSLEPDYCDDLAAEASVTIIERAGSNECAPDRGQADAAGSLSARIHGMGEAPDIVPDEYAAYQGPIEEAVVEIVELPTDGQNAASGPESSGPTAPEPEFTASQSGDR